MTNMNTISTIAIPQGAPLVLLSLPFCFLLPRTMHWFPLHKHDHLILIPQIVHPFSSPKVSCSHPNHPHFHGCVMVSLNESKLPLFLDVGHVYLPRPSCDCHLFFSWNQICPSSWKTSFLLFLSNSPFCMESSIYYSMGSYFPFFFLWSCLPSK